MALVLDGIGRAGAPSSDAFLSPWHCLLYAALATMLALIGMSVGRARASGAHALGGIPLGYELSLVGIGVFVIADFGHAAWHLHRWRTHPRYVGVHIAGADCDLGGAAGHATIRDMLTREENELVSRVGPGTPMGDLMRRYWLPAMLSTELPSPDCTPVRVKLLGEQLIGFRDSNGAPGLIQNNCPHRGASLFFGRNEEAGLRCVYHGWKFSVDGACVDMPNEPAESDFKHKVRAVAYPCAERGGIVWAYMGPRQEPPPLPDLEPNMLPGAEMHAGAIQRACNWLQALEGDIDTSHLGFLHLGALDPETMDPGTFNYYTVKDRRPRYAVVDTDGGSMYGAYRPAAGDVNYWRIAQFLFPFYALIPTGVLGLSRLIRAWVPMDDEHTMFFVMGAQGSVGAGISLDEVQPNTSDWYGRFLLRQNGSNDYMIDRSAQRALRSYTGLSSVHLEDLAITESMGTLLDRSAEHLGTSDVMVIRVRRRLMAAALALREHSEIPPGAENPQVYRVRSGSVFLPKDADWVSATEDLRKAFVEHPELDPNPRVLV